MEHGGGWVLGRRDGLGLALEPGLASRRGGPRFEGEASGCLPFSFQRLLGQRGRGGSGGRGRRRGKGLRRRRLQAVCLSVHRGLDRRARSWGASGTGTGFRCPSGEGQTGKKGLAGNVDPREGGQQRRGCRRARPPTRREGHCRVPVAAAWAGIGLFSFPFCLK